MQLKTFVLGALMLLSLSSCNVKDSGPQAQQPVVTQNVAAEQRSTLAPAKADEGDDSADYNDEDLSTLDEQDSEDIAGDAPQYETTNQGSSGEQPATVDQIQALASMGMQTAQQRLDLANSAYAMAQQVGNQQTMETSERQIQMHRQMYSEYEAAAQNPQAYTDPRSAAALILRTHEYNYRSQTGDQRPTAQIQAQLTQFVAQAEWKSSTPEGQAAYQAELKDQAAQSAAFADTMTAGHNARMAAIQNSAAAHNARMTSLHNQADARNAAWELDQRVGDEAQAQRVHALNGEYEYVNPNSGQRYWLPADTQNPSVMNADGTQTDLQEYHPSDNY